LFLKGPSNSPQKFRLKKKIGEYPPIFLPKVKTPKKPSQHYIKISPPVFKAKPLPPKISKGKKFPTPNPQ